MNEVDLNKFIGKNTKELEKELGFDYYLETKDFLFLKPKQDHKILMTALFEFTGNKKIKVMKTYDGVIEKFFDVPLEKVKENIFLYGENKGEFYDEDMCVSYPILGEDFFAYALNSIIMFSAKEETIKKMMQILDKYQVKYHEPSNLFDERIITNYFFSKKVGRNETCPCGSGKKYKKCCLDKIEGLK